MVHTSLIPTPADHHWWCWRDHHAHAPCSTASDHGCGKEGGGGAPYGAGRGMGVGAELAAAMLAPHPTWDRSWCSRWWWTPGGGVISRQHLKSVSHSMASEVGTCAVYGCMWLYALHVHHVLCFSDLSHFCTPHVGNGSFAHSLAAISDYTRHSLQPTNPWCHTHTHTTLPYMSHSLYRPRHTPQWRCVTHHVSGAMAQTRGTVGDRGGYS